MSKCIIIGNGKSPAKSVVTYLRNKGYATLFCADGGLRHAHKMKLIPDYIIGDFDSVDKKLLQKYEGKSKIIYIKRQNDTDIEKCLKIAIKKGFTEGVLVGVTGDRLDHSFCNLGIALKFYGRINIKIISETSLLAVYDRKVELATRKGEYLSLYAFNSETLVTSKGLKYKLLKTKLPFGERESTSNVTLGSIVNLNIERGKIFVIRDFDTMRKNDLLK